MAISASQTPRPLIPGRFPTRTKASALAPFTCAAHCAEQPRRSLGLISSPAGAGSRGWRHSIVSSHHSSCLHPGRRRPLPEALLPLSPSLSVQAACQADTRRRTQECQPNRPPFMLQNTGNQNHPGVKPVECAHTSSFLGLGNTASISSHWVRAGKACLAQKRYTSVS